MSLCEVSIYRIEKCDLLTRDESRDTRSDLWALLGIVGAGADRGTHLSSFLPLEGSDRGLDQLQRDAGFNVVIAGMEHDAIVDAADPL